MMPEGLHRTCGRLFIALPLVCSLLALSMLLWSRDDPDRQGGFCTNVTMEIESFALVVQDEPERLQDFQWVLNEVVERVDANRLSAVVPDDLREEADLLEELAVDHRRAVEDAAAKGVEPPQPSPELGRSFLVFVGRYASDCVSAAGDLFVDQASVGRPSAIRGR